MGLYTEEDYARDLQKESLNEVLGHLCVTKQELKYLSSLRKERGQLSATHKSVFKNCRSHLPLILAEIERRGEKIPHWVDESILEVN